MKGLRCKNSVPRAVTNCSRAVSFKVLGVKVPAPEAYLQAAMLTALLHLLLASVCCCPYCSLKPIVTTAAELPGPQAVRTQSNKFPSRAPLGLEQQAPSFRGWPWLFKGNPRVPALSPTRGPGANPDN